MELRVLSREAVERYRPERVEVCISISDPLASPAMLSPGFAAVLRLAFSDIVAVQCAEDILFSPEQASAIVEFVDRWRHADRLVVHCHAGLSRSPGVALGLCDRYGWSVDAFEAEFPYWNRLVRQVLLEKGPGSPHPAG